MGERVGKMCYPYMEIIHFLSYCLLYLLVSDIVSFGSFAVIGFTDL